MNALFLWLVVACGDGGVPDGPAPGASTAAAAPAPAPTGPSLYDLEVALVDQRGDGVTFDVHRGHPTLVGMFYASCPSACPMLVHGIQAFEGALDPAERADLRVLLVSLDPERDTPEALAAAVEQFGVDGSRWTLARADEPQVRAVAAVLGVKYRPAEDGEILHSSVAVLLDGEGRERGRLDGTPGDAARVTEALRGR